MTKRLRNLLTPTIQEPVQRQKATRLIRVIAFLVGVCSLAAISGIILNFSTSLNPLMILLPVTAVLFWILALWLLRTGYQLPALILTFLVLLGVCLATFFWPASLLITQIFLALLVLSGGFLLGPIPAILLALLSGAAFYGAGWLQINQRLLLETISPTAQESSTFTIGLLLLGIFTIVLDAPTPAGETKTIAAATPQKNAPQEIAPPLARKTLPYSHTLTGEILRLATEALPPMELVARAVALIHNQIGSYHTSIYLIDESGMWAEIAGCAGIAGRGLLGRRHRLAVGSASFIGWVTKNLLPHISHDVDQDPFYFKHPMLPDTRSEMVIPLLLEERAIGALDIQSKQPQAFDEDLVRIAEAMANEVSVAIENARLLTDTRNRLDLVEREFSGQFYESWQHVLQQHENYIFQLGANSPEINPDTKKLHTKVAASGNSYMDKDLCTIVVPIQLHGLTIATVSTSRNAEEGLWSEDDLVLIEALASQTSMALETSRQYSEEQRRVAELEIVNRISQAVSQLIRLDSLYRVVHSQMNLVLGRTDLSIALYDAQKNILSFPYATENNQIFHIEPGKLAHDPESEVIQNRQPLYLQDPAALLKSFPKGLQHRPRAKSWLGVPLLVGNEVVGIIAIHDPRQENRYSEDDSALLTTIASQIATAIQNAQLLEQIQNNARRERLIREITTKIRRAPDIQSILETSARELGRALNVSFSTVQLGAGAQPIMDGELLDDLPGQSNPDQEQPDDN